MSIERVKPFLSTLLICLVSLGLSVAPLLAEEPEHVRLQPDAGAFPWTYGPYRYDGTGNIASIGTQAFLYDTSGRLVSATIDRPDQPGSQTQTFTYDPYGNLVSKTLGSPTTIPTDPASNHLTGLSAAYDDAGNVTRWQPPGASYQYRYRYDAFDMVQSSEVTDANGTRIIGAGRLLNLYTAGDERIASWDTNADVEHWKIRDLQGRVLRDYVETCESCFPVPTISLARDYVYRDEAMLAAVAPSSSTHFSLDHLGTPRLITDANSLKVGFHHYMPFGEEWTIGSGNQEGEVKKFTGHERDADLDPTGPTVDVDYMHARYYMASFGRFLSTDPVLGNPRRPQSLNRYAYVLDSPLNYVDPSGMQMIIWGEPPEPHWSESDLIAMGEATTWRMRSDNDAWVRSIMQTGQMALHDFWPATWRGGAAFVDGVIPFGDPLEEFYDDGRVDGVEYSRTVGEITRDVEIAIYSAGATMETRAGAEAGNWVTKNVFRWGKGVWGKSKVPKWHFHAGPGKAMVHHLPYQFNTWRYHAAAIVTKALRQLW